MPDKNLKEIPFIQVGTLINLTEPCLQNEPGTTGLCVNVYNLGNRDGYFFIFPNGQYDGFSPYDVHRFMDVGSNGFCPELADYNFSNVIQLSRDFDDGRFDVAFEDLP